MIKQSMRLTNHFTMTLLLHGPRTGRFGLVTLEMNGILGPYLPWTVRTAVEAWADWTGVVSCLQRHAMYLYVYKFR